MYKSINKAFTLVELLIVMAIIAVLIAIAAYGIGLVQRNSRNTQRAEFLNKFKIGIERYYTNLGRYPQAANICWNNGTKKIVMKSNTGSIIGAEVDIPRTDFLQPAAPPLTPKTSTYCYAPKEGGLYSLQFQRETNGGPQWSQQLGSSDDPCFDDNPSTVLTITNC